MSWLRERQMSMTFLLLLPLSSSLPMEMSALTRSVVKCNHAIIAPDGYINSNVPGWTGCTVNAIINE